VPRPLIGTELDEHGDLQFDIEEARKALQEERATLAGVRQQHEEVEQTLQKERERAATLKSDTEAFREFWVPKVDAVEIWRPHNFGDGRDYRSRTEEKTTCGRPENGPFQIPFVFEGITDVQGRFRVRVPAGKYNLSAPVEFFPGTEITVAIRQIVQRTIRMAIHATSGAFTICIDCANRQSYTPSEAVVEEFRADRDDPLSALASGAEPDVGWEFYQPPVPEALRNNASAPVGTVVVEGYVQTNGVVRDLRIVAASHPLLGSATLDSLRDMRWRPARVRGRAVEVPLHLTFEYVRATP